MRCVRITRNDNCATRRYLLFVSAAAIWFAGCVGNRAYRDRDSRPWAEHPATDAFVSGEQLDQYERCDQHSPDHRFDLSYVEFDEKGDFWDRRQLGWTVQAIRHVAATNDLVLVVYIHGWQNDASTLRGHDVAKFHCLLQHLADADGGKRRFFGVYIGWRGKSVPGGDGIFAQHSLPDIISKAAFFIPHELSIFSRKNAATRVAGMPVTETIFQSVAAARNGAKKYGHAARTVLIGHSLGALLLEKAMAQALAAKIISEGESFNAPADFVVLLNSAADSIYAKEMLDMFRRRQVSGHSRSDEVSSEHPLLVSITSQADSATGTLFPIGTNLSNAFSIFRKYEWDSKYGQSSHNVSQRKFFTHTPGHNELLVSHEVSVIDGKPRTPIYEENDTCRPELLDAFERNLNKPLGGPNGEIRFVTAAPDGEQTTWEIHPRLPDRLQTPYWIIRVPKEIIRDHSDIFNENSIALMGRLFRASNPSSQPGMMAAPAPRTMRLAEPGETGAAIPKQQ
jgi:hypothetical protein